MRALKTGISIIAGLLGIAQTAAAGELTAQRQIIFPIPQFHIIPGPRSIAATSGDTVVALTNGEIYATDQNGNGRDLTIFTNNEPLAITGYNSAGYNHVVVATADGNIWDLGYSPGTTATIAPRQIGYVQQSWGPTKSLSAWVDAKGYTNIAVLESAPAGGFLWVMQNAPGLLSTPLTLLGSLPGSASDFPIDVAGQDSIVGGSNLNQVEVAYSSHIERFCWPDAQTTTLTSVQQASDVYWPTASGAVSFSILGQSPWSNENGIATASDLWTWAWDWYSIGYTSINSPGVTFDQQMSFPAAPTSIVGVNQAYGEIVYDVALANGAVWQVTAPISFTSSNDTVGTGSGRQLFQIW